MSTRTAEQAAQQCECTTPTAEQAVAPGKRRGRPPKAPEDRTGVFALRMTPAQRDKLQRLAAAQAAKLGTPMSDAGWLLWQLDRAKDPG